MATIVFINDITATFSLDSFSYLFPDPWSVTQVVGWAGQSH